MFRFTKRRVPVLLFLLCSTALWAENGEAAWLRYAPLDAPIARRYQTLAAAITVLGDGALLKSAQTEVLRGVRGMLGRTLRVSFGIPSEPAIVVGTVEQVQKLDGGFRPGSVLERGPQQAWSWLAGVGARWGPRWNGRAMRAEF